MTIVLQARIVLLGVPFDFEQLSRTCEELGRWSFFVTTLPLNMPGCFVLYAMATS